MCCQLGLFGWLEAICHGENAPMPDTTPPCFPWPRTHSFTSRNAARAISCPVVVSDGVGPFMTMSNIQRPFPAGNISVLDAYWECGLRILTADPFPGQSVGIGSSIPPSDLHRYWGVALCECVESIQTAIVVEVGAELSGAALDLDIVGGRCCCGSVD